MSTSGSGTSKPGLSEGEVRVVGLGAQTAIGGSGPQIVSSVRAVISRFQEHPYLVDRGGEKIIVSAASWHPPNLSPLDRLAEMVRCSVQDALLPLGAIDPKRLEPIPVFVGLPPNRPGRGPDWEKVLTTAILEASSGRVKPEPIAFLPHGHASGLMALEKGWNTLKSGKTPFCLVGGAESYLAPETLLWLEQRGQLHSADQRWGFVPGEAAAFCLLAAVSGRNRIGESLPAILAIESAGLGKETNLNLSGQVCLGEGLTEAFSKALDPLAESAKIQEVICDMNGEPYRGDEYGFTIMKTSSRFQDPRTFATPAEKWGDVGAASGPLFVLLADANARRQTNQQTTRTLLWASSDSGERAAVVLKTLTNSASIPSNSPNPQSSPPTKRRITWE